MVIKIERGNVGDVGGARDVGGVKPSDDSRRVRSFGDVFDGTKRGVASPETARSKGVHSPESHLTSKEVAEIEDDLGALAEGVKYAKEQGGGKDIAVEFAEHVARAMRRV